MKNVVFIPKFDISHVFIYPYINLLTLDKK